MRRKSATETMKTQIGPNPATAVSPTAGQVAKVPGQNPEKVQVVVSPAKTGEKLPQQDTVARQHQLLADNERLTIEKDRTTGKFIYKTIDRETGEVIRQWPREKMLQAIGRFREAEGLLIDKKV